MSTTGDELFQRLVRGDAMVGLIADIPGTKRRMMDALWAEARAGSVDAFRVLGDCYLAALQPIGAFDGVSPDDADARSWSDEAAFVEDANLSLRAALRCYLEAARLGDGAAAVQFARASRSSMPQNQQRARALLESRTSPTPAESYQLGLVQNWLGELEASAKSHESAAARGDTDAQFELYVYYAQGLGVKADADVARSWLDRAAQGNHPRALYNLAAAYASGSGGERSLDKARTYYERAAEHGNGRAAATLGAMILLGQLPGTKENAIHWLDRADELGYPSWQTLDAIKRDDPRDE